MSATNSKNSFSHHVGILINLFEFLFDKMEMYTKTFIL